jgi:hypothetical protein
MRLRFSWSLRAWRVLVDVEGLIAILAADLGLIHRLVGLPQQLIGVDVFERVVEGDSGARRDLQHELVDLLPAAPLPPAGG